MEVRLFIRYAPNVHETGVPIEIRPEHSDPEDAEELAYEAVCNLNGRRIEYRTNQWSKRRDIVAVMGSRFDKPQEMIERVSLMINYLATTRGVHIPLRPWP